MPTIEPSQQVYTLVNVFRVAPENQQPLVDLLVEATDEVMRKLPGFVSANIHKSHDGTKVVNYAQWRSREDFQAMMENKKARAHIEQAAHLVESYDPIFCDVAESVGSGV